MKKKTRFKHWLYEPFLTVPVQFLVAQNIQNQSQQGVGGLNAMTRTGAQECSIKFWQLCIHNEHETATKFYTQKQNMT